MNIYFPSSRGSALLVSLIILILVTIVTTVFLERIWGSAQTVQGIEASNAAYYQAIGIIEQQLIEPGVTKKTPWNIAAVSRPMPQGYTGRYLNVLTGSSNMPATGSGNSPYDSNYNIIALGQPVQIVIPPGLSNWTNVNFEFRVPKISTTSGTGVAGILTNSGLILWTLGYSGSSLYASGETHIFQGKHINTYTNEFSSFSGRTNTGTVLSISEFYTDTNYLGSDGARCTNYACTLKLSLIRPIITSDTVGGPSDGRSLPFLEYRINFGAISVPSQFMILDATSYSYGFQRTKTVRIPQITTNTALDFAVLQ